LWRHADHGQKQGPARWILDQTRPITEGRPAEIRLAARQTHSAPKVAAFVALAESQLALIPGKGDLAKAFRYGLSRKDAFSLFLSDGRVAIDTDAVEQPLSQPFCGFAGLSVQVLTMAA
jgi:transposase